MGTSAVVTKSAITSYVHAYEDIQREIAGLGEAELKWKPARNAWSITEVLTHLVDHSLVVSFRIRDILAGTTVQLPAFNQDAWITGQKANEESTEELLIIAQGLVRYNARLLERLSDEDWAKSGINAKGEPVSIALIIPAFVAHVQNHLGQIRRIKQGIADARTNLDDKTNKGSALLIRLATEDDRLPVEEVLLDAYGQYQGTLSEEGWSDYKQSILHAIHEASTSARIVAELNGQVVGSVFMFDSSETAYGNPTLGIQSPIIRLLGVSRHARGAGVATALIREAAKLAMAQGADSLYLHTSDMMDAAIRLYERLGFERAYDKELMKGEVLVKSYRLQLV